MLLPPSVVWMTKPVFALAPWNGPLLCASPAKLWEAARTSAIKDTIRFLLFMDLSMFVWLVVAGGLAVTAIHVIRRKLSRILTALSLGSNQRRRIRTQSFADPRGRTTNPGAC